MDNITLTQLRKAQDKVRVSIHDLVQLDDTFSGTDGIASLKKAIDSLRECQQDIAERIENVKKQTRTWLDRLEECTWTIQDDGNDMFVHFVADECPGEIYAAALQDWATYTPIVHDTTLSPNDILNIDVYVSFMNGDLDTPYYQVELSNGNDSHVIIGDHTIDAVDGGYKDFCASLKNRAAKEMARVRGVDVEFTLE